MQSTLFFWAMFALASAGCAEAAVPKAATPIKSPVRICPPHRLKHAQGNIINPVEGINATMPCSPRQTFGTAGRHDCDKITQGYHFTQGKGEAVPADVAARYQWVSLPGNYGGTWRSPAALEPFGCFPRMRHMVRTEQ
jgi:hypothetical protein